MVSAWVLHSNAVAFEGDKIFRLSPEEIETDRTAGFNFVDSSEAPPLLPFVRTVLADSRRRCFMDENQYADVTLYGLNMLHKGSRCVLTYRKFCSAKNKPTSLQNIGWRHSVCCSPIIIVIDIYYLSLLIANLQLSSIPNFWQSSSKMCDSWWSHPVYQERPAKFTLSEISRVSWGHRGLSFCMLYHFLEGMTYAYVPIMTEGRDLPFE